MKLRSASLLVFASVLVAISAYADSAAQARSPQGQPRARAPMTQIDANRLAQQATFGPNEAMVADIQASGPSSWVKAQIALGGSQYTSGGDDKIDSQKHKGSYCNGPTHSNDKCYLENRTSEPLMEDFYRNATTGADQIHQRAALALQHIFVISSVTILRTYGMRNYFNTIMNNALGNYRDVLKGVAMSPVMGDYLNNVNNDRTAPNENFAREQLQLFSLGLCMLNLDGSLQGGTCQPTYDNDMVREYAFSMTGWTYPPGGADHRNCQTPGTNCQFYTGDMVVVKKLHDTNPHTLLGGYTVPAGSTAPQALEVVLDSIMAHPNIGPFVAYRMIQDFVSSNPSPGYISRVATAFNTGTFTSSDGVSFGTGTKGDMQATIAAVLLDSEARSATVQRSQGFLRDPIMFFTGTLRALNGKSDGRDMGDWGTFLGEDVFRPPSVFDFYPPDYPVAGTPLTGPQFGIHNGNSELSRLNWLNFILYEGGAPPVKKKGPESLGTQIDDKAFLASAADAGTLVDRLSTLAFGYTLPAVTRQPVIDAVTYWDATTAPHDWKHKRVDTAAYLVFGSPDYEVQR